VVKVGALPRAGAVQIIPPFYAYSGHRDMQRIQLDLKASAGRDAFLGLAASADVVIESFRPGVVDRLGVGYDAVRAVNDAIVYCSTSGYGQTGPHAQWAGHDVNYLAAGGMHAVMAILAALVRKERMGEGAYLDVSIADGVLAMMGLYVDEYLATGAEPGPGHYILTGRYACYDTYRCGDGRWVSVGAIEPPFFRNLCTLLGCEQWADHQLDDDVQDQIRTDFRAAFATRSRDEWVAELAPADTCVAPVYTVAEAVEDEQVKARGLVADADHETEGAFRQLGTVLAGTDTARRHFTVRDATRTDTDELLSAAGYTSDQIASLREEGAVA
jgi:alpha-methylacyl-CoA racemase